MQNKKPRNAKRQRHGIWERYHTNGQLHYKGEYINGKQHGQWISYHTNGQIWVKGTYIKGELELLLEVYNSDGTINDVKFYAR
jgi:antitoxin component YwqK of YwqJK toxin-antitoxin module